MTKQTYQTPATTLFALHTEGMMATSLRIGGNTASDTKVTTETEVLSNGRAWSSDNWNAADED